MALQSAKRRRLLGAANASALTLMSGISLLKSRALAATVGSSGVVRIGFQKYGTLIILKARGTLEKRLEPLGIEVKWSEFSAGPQLLEALNVGSIDFGTVGEAPPIFAQAAGADLIYVGNEPPAPAAEAIIVPHDSPITKLADLRDKKVALNKGANVHYLLVRALQEAKLPYQQIQTVFLTPSDARAAFERGSVDAWAIWDPFLAAAEVQLNARVLVDGEGLVSNHQFYLASRSYATSHADVVRLVLDELGKIDAWGKQNAHEVAVLLAQQIGLDLAVTELASKRFSFGLTPVDASVIQQQQQIADTFTE